MYVSLWKNMYHRNITISMNQLKVMKMCLQRRMRAMKANPPLSSRYFIEYKVRGGTIDLPTEGDTNIYVSLYMLL